MKKISEMTKQELRQRHHDILAEYDKLDEQAKAREAGKRAFTPEEQEKWDALEREDKQISSRLRGMVEDAQLQKELRDQENRNQKLREYLKGVRENREDSTTILFSKTATNTAANIEASGAVTLKIEDIIDTKENGLGLPPGVTLVTGVTGDDLYPYSINDVEMQEVGEVEAINDQALDFDNIKVASHRVALKVSISNKAIDNAAFDLVGFVTYKLQKAWAIYFAKKIYSHADWNNNKGPFSLVTAKTMTLDATIGESIDVAIAEINELGFDEQAVIVISPSTEAKLKHTYEGNGAAAKAIIDGGLLAGHPYVVTKHINYKLNTQKKYVKESDNYLGIGFFNYLAVQQHGEVRQTTDATSAAVAAENKTVMVFNTEISITELSQKVNGNTSGKPQAFALYKLTAPAAGTGA